MKKFLFLMIVFWCGVSNAALPESLNHRELDKFVAGSSGNTAIRVVLDSNVYPDVDNIYDVGSAAKSFKNLYADGTIYSGNVSINTTGSRAKLDVDGDVYIKSTAQTALNVYSNINGYSQIKMKNGAANASASSDIVVEANNGSETTHYLDIGMNSSLGGQAPFTGPNTSYIYSVDDNIYIGSLGTGTGGAIAFYTAGGTSAPNERMRITSTGNIGIGSASPAQKLAIDGQVYLSNTTVVGGYVLCREASAAGRLGHCTSLTAASGVCATCVVP